MPYEIDETHDPSLESWVESANDPETDFPIQNLPLSLWEMTNLSSQGTHILVPIGDSFLDLDELVEHDLLDRSLYPTFHYDDFDDASKSLAAVMRSSPETRRRLRERISDLLTGKDPSLRDNPEAREECLLDGDDVHEDAMPETHSIGDYTDFYSSREHATNVGIMFRGKDNALQPNWLHLPVGYHGRASSVVVSGTPVVRPRGQLQLDPLSEGAGAEPLYYPPLTPGRIPV